MDKYSTPDVLEVKVLDNYLLKILFDTKEEKIFDDDEKKTKKDLPEPSDFSHPQSVSRYHQIQAHVLPASPEVGLSGYM